MGFTTHCSARRPRRPSLLLALGLLLLGAFALAGEIAPQRAEVRLGNAQIEISARFSITLPPGAEAALQNGTSLPFTYQFQLKKPRLQAWYQQVKSGFGVTSTTTYRLSYHPLTRQYRVASNGITRNFASLHEALQAIGTIGGWVALKDTSAADDPDSFAGRVRLILDFDLLPKPMQISALGNNDWRIEPEWQDLKLAVEKDE
ncbi:DUF4390 domain-containing protein [Chitinilyticum piscinae]|uniref:DUF4390 domain-containing protein n=1 Tax=Chitinilyticum piscinae TaxID=2866724 RepID=A0A8J7FK29_9NEIS|nr:DUF4390 domain-containing protein [Chitinilyticum piscinae]MBE9610608.1 DUF4390 domain-containing protein [Chitinilyticum piscinae]